MPEEAAGTLRVGEAVELAHALLTRLAELEGVRILFIKGPTAVQMGARPPRPSSDVDVLCEPGGMEKIAAALERCGWRRRVPANAKPQFVFAAKYLFEHSVHYIHDEWPCDLDIHYNFPGFFAPDDVVFEALWSRRATAEVAHWPVPCADMLGQAIIVGLHALRDPEKSQSKADLDHLSAALQTAGAEGRLAFVRLAASTGSSQALRPMLDRLGTPAMDSPWADLERAQNWRVHTSSTGLPTTAWLMELQAAPWLRKPQLIRRALIRPGAELLRPHVGIAPSRRNIAKLQSRRWCRALRYLPEGLMAVWRAGRGGDERD